LIPNTITPQDWTSKLQIAAKQNSICRWCWIGPGRDTGPVRLVVDRSNELQLGCNWSYWKAGTL